MHHAIQDDKTSDTKQIEQDLSKYNSSIANIQEINGMTSRRSDNEGKSSSKRSPRV